MRTDPEAHAHAVRLTVVVPATNRPPTLEACLTSIKGAAAAPEQIVVVDDPSIRHPALARNAGARQAIGDVLVFVDADVTVHHDVFERIRRAFETDPALVAMFGSYDDVPAARGVVSVFRNLLHHHVHQSAPGPAGTFWAGLGAIRRPAFEASGGFIEHPIEDIELGMRLSSGGARIVLDPTVQGTHLKDWRLGNMVRTDLFVRGIPWVGLLLEYRGSASTSALNLGWRHRLSALASVFLLLTVLFLRPWWAIGALVVIVALNGPFYRLLVRCEGLPRAAVGVLLHILHLLVAVTAVPVGIIAYRLRRKRSGVVRHAV